MRRALYWLAMFLAATAVVGGASYAVVSYRATSGPDGAVRGYFEALQRGDAAGALAFGATGSGPHDLLTDEVLADQLRVAPIRDVQVDTSTQAGSPATVAYSYALAFRTGVQEVAGRLPVVDTGSGWRLMTTAVPAVITGEQGVDRWSFAGTTVPDGRTLLFPGALPIRFDTPLLQVDPSTASVGFAEPGGTSSPARIDVRIEPTRATRVALVGKVQRLLTACVTVARPAADCPLSSPREVPGSLRGRVTPGRLVFRVTTEAAGPISISGSAQYVGRYRMLRYDNTVVSHRGRLSLPVDAIAFPVAPLTVHFQDGT